MNLTREGTIQLDTDVIIQPWYLEGADWKEHDLSAMGLSESEITEAKSLMTDEAKATFIHFFGADPRQ